jgi:hypothetical protein
MVSFYGKVEEVGKLIAAKDYGRAATLLKGQLRQDTENVWLRQQLADVLVMGGERDKALEVLDSLVDTFMQGGFHQKAIAVVKRMQRLAPEDPANEERLAMIVRTQEEELARARMRQSPAARGQAVPSSPEEAARQAAFQAALKQPTSSRFAAQAKAAEPAAPPSRPTPPPRASLPPVPPPRPVAKAPAPPPIDDIVIEVDRGPGSEAGELKGLARSPLFGQFTPSDLLAVVRALALKTCDPGEILITEGEPGGSLFVLVSGSARVFVRDKEGRNRQVRTLQEGEMFGEVSLITGQPRTATVTAGSPCELLELDQMTLRAISADHPQVPLVIGEICDRRAGSREELAARGASQPRS